jgi:hypothetical protein
MSNDPIIVPQEARPPQRRPYRKTVQNPPRPGNASRNAGLGVVLPSGERQIVCAFDDETFAEIRALALRSKISFRAQVRLLVEFGLEDIKAGAAE